MEEIGAKFQTSAGNSDGILYHASSHRMWSLVHRSSTMYSKLVVTRMGNSKFFYIREGRCKHLPGYDTDLLGYFEKE